MLTNTFKGRTLLDCSSLINGGASILKRLVIAWIVAMAAFTGDAQGALEAILFPDSATPNELSGYATFYTPDTSSAGPLYPVSFQIIVNSNQPTFSVGRIVGGGTAWAFDIDPPTSINGTNVYSGTTDMAAHQIDDMLAANTDFELYAYPASGEVLKLSGALVPAPEPSTFILAAIGMVIVYFGMWRIRKSASERQAVYGSVLPSSLT